ncbi:hypothetical protein CPT_Madawaska_251 [Staphylococcus phage Madawaska]|nr:hypothetical protein CPT_Madawaska_251 [Staphylococcus phage Madawaska]
MKLFNIFKKEDKRFKLIRNKFREENISAVIKKVDNQIEIEYLLFGDKFCLMHPSYYSKEDTMQVENKIRAVMAYYGYLDNEYIMYADVI